METTAETNTPADPETSAVDVKGRGDDWDTYYQQLHAKHFDAATATGSLFTGVADLDELLALAVAQRGSLDGDDRHLFDVPDGVLRDTASYLRVTVTGEAGDTSAAALDPDTPVTVRRTKTGVPPDLVVAGTRRPVEHATIVMVDEVVDGTPTGRRLVITAFPGNPSTPVPADREQLPDGAILRAGDLPPDTLILIDPQAPGQAIDQAVTAADRTRPFGANPHKGRERNPRQPGAI